MQLSSPILSTSPDGLTFPVFGGFFGGAAGAASLSGFRAALLLAFAALRSGVGAGPSPEPAAFLCILLKPETRTQSLFHRNELLAHSFVIKLIAASWIKSLIRRLCVTGSIPLAATALPHFLVNICS